MPSHSHGLHFSTANLHCLDKVKSTYLKRVLGLPQNTQNRLVLLMAATNTLVEEGPGLPPHCYKTVSGAREENPGETISYPKRILVIPCDDTTSMEGMQPQQQTPCHPDVCTWISF